MTPREAELLRVAKHVTCSICGKAYDSEPCGLVDHIEGHEALRAYDAPSDHITVSKARPRSLQSLIHNMEVRSGAGGMPCTGPHSFVREQTMSGWRLRCIKCGFTETYG